jgi:hypothetical protein
MTGSGAELHWNPRGKDEATTVTGCRMELRERFQRVNSSTPGCMAQEPLRVDMEIIRPATHEI